MLLTLLILQALITHVLNQTHQQVISAQQQPVRGIPLVIEPQNAHFELVFTTPERQFYSARFKICVEQQCDEFVQFFSVGSAILKDDIRFHAMRTL